MNEQTDSNTQEQKSEPKGFFQRFWQKLDDSVKEKAEKQASEGCCCNSDDKKDGSNKCC